jgi:hypothetical protein
MHLVLYYPATALAMAAQHHRDLNCSPTAMGSRHPVLSMMGGR